VLSARDTGQCRVSSPSICARRVPEAGTQRAQIESAGDRFPGRELEETYVAARIAAAGAGYDVVLHVVMIPLALSAPRVAARVAGGGHDVPADKLRAR